MALGVGGLVVGNSNISSRYVELVQQPDQIVARSSHNLSLFVRLGTFGESIGDILKTIGNWLALACVVSCASLAQADWIEKSDINAMAVLEAQAAFVPENVATFGLSQYDADIMDLKPGLFRRSQASNSALLAQMQKRLADEKHPKVRQDLEILIQSITDELEAAEIQRAHLLPYYNLHEGLFFGFHSLLDPRNEKSRYPKALERLQKYIGKKAGSTPLTELAIARTQERFEADGLLGPYRGQLEADLDNAPRYVAGIRSLLEGAGLAAWEDDFALLEKQLDDYQQWLQSTLLPRARANNQLPPAVYANNLKNYGVRATPEALISEAQYSYQLIRSEMKALAWRIAEQRGWKDKGLVAVMRALKREQVPQDRILALYQQRLATIEDIIRREDLITLPQRDAVIRLATEAESAASPASFMSPPQLINNTGQYGEFVLVQTNPGLKGDAVMDDWSHDAVTWALTVHEARPGHELQFASLVESGTSLARAIFAFNSANAEGWGLYAESIMQEFLPLEGQLFNLFTRLMRAARMFMDPMVNTGQMTPEEAVSFMTEQVALSLPMASSEADRYAFRAPGQATSYYYGYMNLMRLRTEVEIALGDKFNQRAFHDFILEQGLLPPELLRNAVLEHFTP